MKKLLYFDDHTSPLSKATAAGAEANQSKGGEKLVTLYGDHLESVQNTLNPSEELLYCQLLQSHRKRASESPLPWTAIYSGKNSNSSLTEPVPSTSFAKPVPPPLFSLPSNATPKQIFSLLASLEEEHFRAGLFELAVLDAAKALTVKENGTVDEDLRHRFYSKLAVFSRHIDEVQIADVEAAFNAAFTGLCETVTDFGSTSGQSAQVDRPPEIVDYLVALAALLTATSQLRPAAADVLRSLFTSSVDQLVLYTAGQLSLLSSDLLSPSSNNYLSYENENYYHKYRSVVDGTLLLLRRIFSHRCIPSLGAKVGVKALCALLTTFLPFYVLQNGLVYHHAALYQPIVAFAERRLFLGLSEEEDEVQAAATVAAISSFSSSSSSSSSSTMFSPALTKALIAYYVGYQEHWGNTSTKLKKEKEAITGESNDASYRPTIFEEISKKLKDFSKSTEKLHFLHGFISVVVDETVKERQQMEQKEQNVAPCPPVNCTALLTALLRLLVRLTTEPVAVMAEVLMVPPSALEDGSAAQQISLSNFRLLNTNFNLFSVRETRSTAKWLLSTFWSKAQALLQIMDKNGLDVYGTIQQENTDFQGTLEELLKQLHLLFENYSGNGLSGAVFTFNYTLINFVLTTHFTDPHDTEHLDAKIVELGNDTAGQVLNFLVNNLGTFIWSYFRLVDEELEKMASKSGLYGQHRGQFSVMSAYLSSLDLERPGVVVEMKKEKKLSSSGLIMDFDDEEEDDDAFGGSEEAQEDYYTGGGKSEKEVQFVEALRGVAELDNALGSASFQGSSSSAAPVALGNSSTLKSSTTPEDALSKFSSLMLDKTSQMLKNVEVFVRDLALAEKNLKVCKGLPIYLKQQLTFVIFLYRMNSSLPQNHYHHRQPVRNCRLMTTQLILKRWRLQKNQHQSRHHQLRPAAHLQYQSQLRMLHCLPPTQMASDLEKKRCSNRSRSSSCSKIKHQKSQLRSSQSAVVMMKFNQRRSIILTKM